MPIAFKPHAVILTLILVGPLTNPAEADGLARGEFGNFKRALNTTAYGYTLAPDPADPGGQQWVERFEVRPGDCGSNGGWSDCRSDRERSELSEIENGLHTGENIYQWEFFLPENHTDISPTKVVFGQFHERGSHPVWMFLQRYGHLYLDDQVQGRTTALHRLIDADDLTGRWHTIRVHAKWSSQNDGFLRVSVNGTEKVSYVGKTENLGQVYFRYGLYRSFISRYQNAHSGKAPVAQVIYYRNVNKTRVR